jgi:hypothetical protein
MPRLLAIGFALLLLGSGRQPQSTAGLQAGAEFPPQDLLLWDLEREGLQAVRAARRLNDAPDDPQTVRLLAEAKNLDGMLRALGVVVDTRPRRIPAAFEALGDAAWQFRGDDEAARRNAARLQQIVADVRQRLPGLPREDAARAERVLLTIDAGFARERSPAPGRVRARGSSSSIAEPRRRCSPRLMRSVLARCRNSCSTGWMRSSETTRGRMRQRTPCV